MRTYGLVAAPIAGMWSMPLPTAGNSGSQIQTLGFGRLTLSVTSPIVLPDWKHSLATGSSPPGCEAESATASVGQRHKTWVEV